MLESVNFRSWLNAFNSAFPCRYAYTISSGILIVAVVTISAGVLNSKVTAGANRQLIHTLEAEISEDLTRGLDRLRLSGVPITIDAPNSSDQLDLWIAEVSRDIGASVAVLFDLDGKPVWSSDPAFPASDDFESENVVQALAGGVVTELERGVQLVDVQGRYYNTDAMETYLPLFSASGDEEIGVLEVYVDVKDELESATMAARSNILRSIIQVMGLLTALLIGSVFISEVLLHRAHQRRREADIALNNALQQTRELAIAEQERDKFLSVVSHELKTPLTAILAFTEILTKDRDNLTERQLKHLNLVSRNGRRLDLLIEDLLDVSRIETGSFSLDSTEIPIGELFDDLAQSLASIFRVKSQELVVVSQVGNALLIADRSRIFQVVSNLLSNASKYSSENTTITLNGSVENDCLRISVTDDGPGLTVEEQKLIFQLFYRVPNEYARSVPGMGIGLSIVKAIVDLHNGRITVDSVFGTGSTFILELPGVIPTPTGTYPVSHGTAV